MYGQTGHHGIAGMIKVHAGDTVAITHSESWGFFRLLFVKETAEERRQGRWGCLPGATLDIGEQRDRTISC